MFGLVAAILISAASPLPLAHAFSRHENPSTASKNRSGEMPRRLEILEFSTFEHDREGNRLNTPHHALHPLVVET